ncbi:MAG: nitroreductase family protein [bacterium]
MDVSQAIKERRSVRAYNSKEIPEEALNKLLESARLAPSASNRQQWKFIVVRDKDTRKALSNAASNQKFIADAPVVIAAVSTNPERIMSCAVPAYAVDLAIAVDHITLQATALGLGSCWIGAFSQEEVKKILNVPDEYKVVSLLPVGYPSDSPVPKSRKLLNEIISYETFFKNNPA